MSNDQQIMYASCRALISGHCPEELSKRTFGPICHSRWNTLDIRVNILYMTYANPPEELQRLAWISIHIYSYLWFTAKLRSRVTEVAGLAFETCRRIRKLRPDERRIVVPVFERGFGFWLHAEQLYLCLLADEDSDIRSRAVARLLRQRQIGLQPETLKAMKKTKKAVRAFEIPDIRHEARHYSELIDWQQSQLTEPPYLRKFSDQELRQFEATPLVLNISSNSQFVERQIQVIAKQGKRASSPTLRNGLSIATFQSRKKQPRLATKSDFQTPSTS